MQYTCKCDPLRSRTETVSPLVCTGASDTITVPHDCEPPRLYNFNAFSELYISKNVYIIADLLMYDYDITYIIKDACVFSLFSKMELIELFFPTLNVSLMM